MSNQKNYPRIHNYGSHTSAGGYLDRNTGVIAIIGILAAMLLARIEYRPRRAKISRASAMQANRLAITLYGGRL